MEKRLKNEIIVALVGAAATTFGGFLIGQQTVQVKFESNESTYVAKLNEKDREIETLTSKVNDLEKTLSDTEAVVCADKIAINTNQGELLVDVAKSFNNDRAKLIASIENGIPSVSMQGKDYHNGIKFDWNKGEISFSLEKKYSKLAFNFGQTDDHTYDQFTDLYIYLDDVQVDALHRENKGEPQKYVIEVADVNVIKFKWIGYGSDFALTDMRLYK